jgi:hypothetical protein
VINPPKNTFVRDELKAKDDQPDDRRIQEEIHQHGSNLNEGRALVWVHPVHSFLKNSNEMYGIIPHTPFGIMVML